MAVGGTANPSASRDSAAVLGLAVVLVLGALTAFAPLSIDMYLPGLPAMSADLQTSTAGAQLTLTTCMLGLAFGQLISGPISDARGRRGPVMWGIVMFALSSVACAVAPNLTMLAIARFVQGATGAAGIVIGRAVVRDVCSGVAAARLYGLLSVVTGAVPILAPLFGAQLMRVTSWRGIFATLAIVGALLLVVVWRILPETLASSARHTGGLRSVGRILGVLARDRAFAGYTLALGLSFGAMAAYISGSPFVYQTLHGVSAQTFSYLFALNVVGLIVATQFGRMTVERWGPALLVQIGSVVCVLGAIGCLIVTELHTSLLPLVVCLFVTISSIGLTYPNGTTLALANHPEAAGSASGLIGLTQFLCGAAAAPLVGIAGGHTGRPMGIVIVVSAVASLLALQMAIRADARAGRAGSPVRGAVNIGVGPTGM